MMNILKSKRINLWESPQVFKVNTEQVFLAVGKGRLYQNP